MTDALSLVDDWGPEKIVEEARRRTTTPHLAGRGLAEERVRAAMRSKGRVAP
ncbi:hypothetical protein AB0G35_23605 [Streptomyces sp. NPDC021749]|uniref:hypothetical protein n=1 Tax=Streptomyces sp. NPDC021749 TaxID=3154905 RepID=UPI0033F05F5F